EPAEEESATEPPAQSAPVQKTTVVTGTDEAATPAPREAHTSAELVEMQLGISADAPLCLSCGTKMQRAGSCYICEGCGST
ncbi:hypothetical protein G3I76_70545, partial [Streptomyces sp. SID11233]|nr:hypothetical protein [Streptomyces sp. SID11233]